MISFTTCSKDCVKTKLNDSSRAEAHIDTVLTGLTLPDAIVVGPEVADENAANSRSKHHIVLPLLIVEQVGELTEEGCEVTRRVNHVR